MPVRGDRCAAGAGGDALVNHSFLGHLGEGVTVVSPYQCLCVHVCQFCDSEPLSGRTPLLFCQLRALGLVCRLVKMLWEGQ